MENEFNQECVFCCEIFDPAEMLKINEHYVCEWCQKSEDTLIEYGTIQAAYDDYKKKGYFNENR